MVKYLLLAALANLAVASEIQASPNQIQFPNQWECRQKGMETYDGEKLTPIAPLSVVTTLNHWFTRVV